MHGAHKIIFPKTVPNIKMIPYAAALAFLLVYVSSDSVEAYVEVSNSDVHVFLPRCSAANLNLRRSIEFDGLFYQRRSPACNLSTS